LLLRKARGSASPKTRWHISSSSSFKLRAIVDIDNPSRSFASNDENNITPRTGVVLVRAGIDAPELLFADGANLLLISGLDEQAFREIARYRRQFAGMQQAQTSSVINFPSAAPRAQFPQ
jgi:hypothetical protein